MLDEGFINPGRLAWLPLAFMVEQDAQQTGCTAVADADAAYHEMMTTGCWVYQLYSYYGMVRRRFGEEVAKQVQELQCEIFEREQPGAGAAIISALQLVEIALHASVVGGKAGSAFVALPAELSVALALLMGLPESPDYYADGKGDDRPVYRVAGIDERLASLLEKSKHALLEAFNPVFSASRLS